MGLLKRAVVLMLVGAVLGDVVGTLIARSFIPWYWSPGDVMKNSQQIINVPDVVRGTIDQMVRDQLLGAAIGAGVFLVVGLVLMRMLAKRAAPPVAGAGATP